VLAALVPAKLAYRQASGDLVHDDLAHGGRDLVPSTGAVRNRDSVTIRSIGSMAMRGSDPVDRIHA
jgi:hypothetical protein